MSDLKTLLQTLGKVVKDDDQIAANKFMLAHLAKRSITQKPQNDEELFELKSAQSDVGYALGYLNLTPEEFTRACNLLHVLHPIFGKRKPSPGEVMELAYKLYITATELGDQPTSVAVDFSTVTRTSLFAYDFEQPDHDYFADPLVTAFKESRNVVRHLLLD